MKNSKPNKSFIDKLLFGLEVTCNTLSVLAFAGIILVVLYQIIARTFLPQSPPWTEELSRYLFIYLVTFAAGSLIIKQKHVNLELFQHKLSHKVKCIYNIIVLLIIGVFSVMLINHAWQFMEVGTQTSATLGIQMKRILMSTVIFFIITPLACFLSIIDNIIKFKTPVVEE